MIGFGAIAIGTVLIRRKHHATAFAIVLRHVKQMDDGLFESYSDKLQHIDSRNNLAALPSGNRLACHIELLRKLFLSESFAFPASAIVSLSFIAITLFINPSGIAHCNTLYLVKLATSCC